MAHKARVASLQPPSRPNSGHKGAISNSKEILRNILFSVVFAIERGSLEDLVVILKVLVEF